MREGEIPVFYGEITNEGRQLPPFVCSDCRQRPRHSAEDFSLKEAKSQYFQDF